MLGQGRACPCAMGAQVLLAEMPIWFVIITMPEAEGLLTKQ